MGSVVSQVLRPVTGLLGFDQSVPTPDTGAAVARAGELNAGRAGEQVSDEQRRRVQDQRRRQAQAQAEQRNLAGTGGGLIGGTTGAQPPASRLIGS